ncbi:hypothetical protein [Ulvibacterium marinum]|uniref:Uncharacterized protein n=1 Tax=Ulvibacterium marinum TaxID=2419782 RepID=A0A3B0C186_9FLAO|nr:hypothetical protein [Ulvibacterium marinum]RKN78521.1 hypothetical protein D7Z94_20110 [Ulvibacterium marinum]
MNKPKIENRQLKNDFLDEHIFVGLKNLNDGFDTESIKYFSESDFRIVLERVEKFGLGIYGIEPWQNGTYYDVYGFEDYAKTPTDSRWYNTAFDDFIASGEELLYTATYHMPKYDDQL